MRRERHQLRYGIQERRALLLATGSTVLQIELETGALKELRSRYPSRKLLCLGTAPPTGLIAASGEVVTGDAAKRPQRRQSLQNDSLDPKKPPPWSTATCELGNVEDVRQGSASVGLQAACRSAGDGTHRLIELPAGGGGGLADSLEAALRRAPARRGGARKAGAAVQRSPVEIWRLADLQERAAAIVDG
jgi:hypothetical protein